MHQHCTEFSVTKMASLLGVLRSGYYRYVTSQPSQQCVANETLLQEIKKTHQASRGTYGSPRIYAALIAVFIFTELCYNLPL